ncbi:MAG: TetR/AcrR family transcriptional regulator [Gemmatimonadetes bacterium]|uniref:TetR/AcrR family transcriptional regulator n=1 Tax=Candidatus Kutchimonas denitrificans TaxID=3056748 RepID=A0AAE5CCJ9_9BACT|nr:TetR/AcrR family transcriptional regulator [Gemmatimonadota bacterium]NIR74279.1 TetR/AcrR family transcriptional regulator [Candidatus Kutchimonas denitrificans]NIS02534.1 TetR/AcrR family transcriptional regulator [Gemmatimonadota bacterium]NIT68410.1 TetR/AcrR family transcriptional regulator [Gemmatimonadota bacterium]NIU51862.1 TetR family transcriptional regulator [Gemmatimonadota bacterium]
MAQNSTSTSHDYEEKLQGLLDVAATIFADKGYHHASIRDLSRKAGVSLSGLYYYFSSKEELLYMIQERSLRRIVDSLRDKLEDLDNPEEKLRALVHNHVSFYVSNMAAMRVITQEYDALEGEYRTKIRERRLEYSNLCTEILREVRRFTGGGDVVPLNVATFALFGMMNWIYAWYRPGSNVPTERLAEHLYRLFAGGFTGARRR